MINTYNSDWESHDKTISIKDEEAFCKGADLVLESPFQKLFKKIKEERSDENKN